MKIKQTLKNGSQLLTLGAALLLSFNSAQAAQPGPYIGMGIGSAHDDILDEEDTGFKIYGGVTLTENIGLELAYVDLGTYANGALTQDGISYEIVGYLPLSDNIDIFGKAGLFNWEVANNFTSHTGTDPTFGVGLQAQIQHHVSLRAEYEAFLDVDGGDVDLYSASINLHF